MHVHSPNATIVDESPVGFLAGTTVRWIAGGMILLGGASLLALTMGDIGAWIDARAHMLGHALDRSVGAVASGDTGAWAALLGGSALYGFLHALGPGHGKVLVGGVGAASRVTVRRLVALSFAGSLAQALWAIALVYGALAILGLSIGAVTGLARDVLAPLGAALIAGIGLMMLWRTLQPVLRRFRERARRPHRAHRAHGQACSHHGHNHSQDHGGHHHHGHAHDGHDCKCAHAPKAADVARLESPWDAAMLVAGIAVRPCTSALVVLALAWQAGVPLAGGLAAIAMGLGTALLVGLVATSSVFARRMALIGSDGPAVRLHRAMRVAAGGALTLLGLAMLGAVA